MNDVIGYINGKHINCSSLCRTHMGSFRDGAVYELNLIQYFYERLIKRRKYHNEKLIFLDIGSNAGSYSLIPSVDNNIECYSYEPNDILFNVLNENIALNNIQNLVKTENIGIWSEKKALELKMPHNVQDSGLCTFADNPSRFVSTETQPLRVKTVQCKTVDQLVQEINITKVDAIKIDVEGAELYVLMGAVNILKNMKPLLLLEYYNDNTLSFGYERENITKFLSCLGYENFIIYDRSDIIAE